MLRRDASLISPIPCSLFFFSKSTKNFRLFMYKSLASRSLTYSFCKFFISTGCSSFSGKCICNIQRDATMLLRFVSPETWVYRSVAIVVAECPKRLDVTSRFTYQLDFGLAKFIYLRYNANMTPSKKERSIWIAD